MATIVQNYGPIYGEVVNGTVEGRPNGSIYVPLSNTISLSINGNYIRYAGDGKYKVSTAGGTSVNNATTIVAVAQDLASNIKLGVYSDSDCTILVGNAVNFTAGNFNLKVTTLGTDSSNNLVSGNTYYVMAQLMNNSVPVATSTAVTLEAV